MPRKRTRAAVDKYLGGLKKDPTSASFMKLRANLGRLVQASPTLPARLAGINAGQRAVQANPQAPLLRGPRHAVSIVVSLWYPPLRGYSNGKGGVMRGLSEKITIITIITMWRTLMQTGEIIFWSKRKWILVPRLPS